MKLPEPNKRTWLMHDGRGAPEYYTLKEAAEVLAVVCQCHDLSESDAAALASGLGLTFHVFARPIAMGDTLIIPPYPRPNNAIELHWMDLQRLIDHCSENPQFVKDMRQIGIVDKEKDRIELGEIKGQSIAKAEKLIEALMVNLGEEYTISINRHAEKLRELMLRVFGKKPDANMVLRIGELKAISHMPTEKTIRSLIEKCFPEK